MKPLLSAKGRDVTAWRAAEEFTTAFRQALLDISASGNSGSAETIFASTSDTLDNAIAVQRNVTKNTGEIIAAAVHATSSSALKELTISFYQELYRHFDFFRSAPAFYQLSMEFLRQASAKVISITKEQLGLYARHLPEIALVALGPAGRCEYSPFCQLQTLLVHTSAATSQNQTINLFCHTLHDEFEAAGIALDPLVSPRQPSWRGSLTDWQERCDDALYPQANDDLINLCRLIDQNPLQPETTSVWELKEISTAALRGNYSARTNLVERVSSLSNGLGIMGGFKLERGQFMLLDHGLLPFSAALSALALIMKSSAVSNCERVADLLARREIDVDMAERMLATWHDLHNMRLNIEKNLKFESFAERQLSLNPNELSAEQRHALKDTLESVAAIQRHVEITFSGIGE